MVGDAREHVERELIDAYRKGLNSFFKEINGRLRKLLIAGVEKELFDSLLRIRTYPPLLTLSLSNEPGSDRWRKARLSSLKAVAEKEGFSKLAEQIGDADYCEGARGLLDSINDGNWEVTIQLLEVGSIQELIRSNGAFKEMRGASLLIDIIPRYASRYVAENLGEEFILTKEAGELVFISSPGFSRELEEGIIEHLKGIPLADTIVLKGNGRNPPKLKAGDLITNFGSSYRLALASAKVMGHAGDSVELDPSNICRSCRANQSLDDRSIDELLRSFATAGKVEELRKSLVERAGGKICQSCLVLSTYGHILMSILNESAEGYDEVTKEWNNEVLEAVKEASSFIILSSLRKYFRQLKIGFISDLEDYDYSESSNALIAMLSADGDGFGSLKGESKSIKDFISLSILFSTLMEEGLIEGARNSLKIEEKLIEMREATEPRKYDFFFPITPFYVAGDDMVLILRAEHIVGFIEGLAHVEGIVSNAIELGIIPKDRKVGISMGISVGRTKIPGVYLYDTSHRMLRYTKDVVKSTGGKGFTVQASLLYEKSSASWKSVERFHFDGAKVKGSTLWNSLIWKGKEESPVLKAFKIAIGGDNAVRSSDLKEILEDLLSPEKLHPDLTMLRWLGDIARGMERGEGIYEKLREIFRELTRGGSSELWRSVYALASLLDILEDRVRNEIGSVDLRRKLCEVGDAI